MMEKNNQQTVNFDQTAVSPLNSQVTFLDPLTKAPRQLMGGLVFAGGIGATKGQGQPPGVKTGRRGRGGARVTATAALLDSG